VGILARQGPETGFFYSLVSFHMTTLAKLQDWYTRQCDGAWEHSLGIVIQTCDNPGWWVKINLSGTELDACPFAELAEGVNTEREAQDLRWLSCRVQDHTWHGAGDETQLERILEIFLSWAAENGS
jgi:hypothetical protein